MSLADARTRTERTIELQPFELARTPLTGQQFASVSAALHERAERGGLGLDPSTPVHGVSWCEAILWCNAASQHAGLRPAYRFDGDRVEWDAAADGFRLPTEVEWEHACRAGSDGPHYGELAEVAWTSLDDVEAPQPVGRKRANAFGLHDMLGNVWEWVWDHADTARYGDYRVLRGGGWADRPWSVRASVRRGSAPDAVIDDVGLRVARGAVVPRGTDELQGWSRTDDARRAHVTGPLPIGWTPLEHALR
ncbi:formylglycine-generating enzyme family protein [Microcella sp.]|uniref:formylglycine-generating enzyme family protein n=1 Tax=Microcella sp. TaxID=1913979 RepID=UPI003F7125E5